MSIWRFAELLPPIDAGCRLSLGEGDTPLVPSRRIGPVRGAKRLFLKVESGNPTGSYKDRFAAVAISAMRAAGKTRCIASSSGNSGAALAAYCAAAGIRCEIAIVETAPLGKLTQMLAYGAQLQRVRGFGVDARITQATCARLETLALDAGAALQITAFRYCPIGMQGVQTISYELHEQTRTSPSPIRHVFVPAGGGGLALAVARGFQQLTAQSPGEGPAIHIVQPLGNDTMVTPLRSGARLAQEVACTTAITGLQVPSIIDGNEVIDACRQSGGTGYLVSDSEVWSMQARLAAEEGVFCEPAGAVALCGALQAIERGEVNPDEAMACIVTGSGFKDMASVDRLVQNQSCPTVEYSAL
ncbi:MAG: pyridoxal-phosphate dependent enzyme [Pirellulales bacterium]|nr:pyridoxal-phosphate dependent enzyme [Pirellulales bacterium]